MKKQKQEKAAQKAAEVKKSGSKAKPAYQPAPVKAAGKGGKR